MSKNNSQNAFVLVSSKNRNLDTALNIFKQSLKRNGSTKKFIDILYYEKPSDIKRRKKSKAKLRQKRINEIYNDN